MTEQRSTKQFTPDDFTQTPLDVLLHEASQTRHAKSGDRIELCAIVNAKSGLCSMDCRFCAQSVHYQTQVKTYPLLAQNSLLDSTQANWDRGVHRVGWVTSGCSATDREVVLLAEAAAECRGRSLCASLGQLSSVSLVRLKEAGIRRYHHNLETSGRFYPSVCTTQDWKDRCDTVFRAKCTGLEVCSGGLFGLGETWQDRMDLAITLRHLEVDSVPINFLNPIPGTPLGNRQPLSAEEGLRIIAMFRIMLPNATVRICGGRPTTLGNRQSEMFRAGADALMTGDYLTTSGFSIESDLKMIADNGLLPVT